MGEHNISHPYDPSEMLFGQDSRKADFIRSNDYPREMQFGARRRLSRQLPQVPPGWHNDPRSCSNAMTADRVYRATYCRVEGYDHFSHSNGDRPLRKFCHGVRTEKSRIVDRLLRTEVASTSYWMKFQVIQLDAYTTVIRHTGKTTTRLRSWNRITKSRWIGVLKEQEKKRMPMDVSE